MKINLEDGWSHAYVPFAIYEYSLSWAFVKIEEFARLWHSISANRKKGSDHVRQEAMDKERHQK